MTKRPRASISEASSEEDRSGSINDPQHAALDRWSRIDAREFVHRTAPKKLHRIITNDNDPSFNGQSLFDFTEKELGPKGRNFLRCRDAIMKLGYSYERWLIHIQKEDDEAKMKEDAIKIMEKRSEDAAKFWAFVATVAPSQAAHKLTPFDIDREPLEILLSPDSSAEIGIFKSRVTTDLRDWLEDQKRGVVEYEGQKPEAAFSIFISKTMGYNPPREYKNRDLFTPKRKIPIELKIASYISKDHLAQLIVYLAKQYEEEKKGEEILPKKKMKGAVFCQSRGQMKASTMGFAGFDANFVEVTFHGKSLPTVQIKEDFFGLCSDGKISASVLERMVKTFMAFFGDEVRNFTILTDIPVIDDEDKSET